MTDRLLRIEEVAALLGTGSKRAAKFLNQQKLRPYDFGRGCKGGKRWLESAVIAAMRRAFTALQPHPQRHRPSTNPGMDKFLADAKAAEVMAMIAEMDKDQPLKKCSPKLTECQVTQ